MVRPRRDSDEAVLERIASAISSREAITPWTLTEVAPAAGLSAAGLLKRFGSRQGVLAALSRRWIAEIPQTAQGTLPPMEELRRWVEGRFSPSHGGAQGLSQLIDDLLDEELRRLLAEGWHRERAYLASLLGASALRGATNPDMCATVLFDALNGAALRAVVEGNPDPVFEILDALLEEWT